MEQTRQGSAQMQPRAASLWNLTSDLAAIEEALMENGGELTPEIEEALNANTEALATKIDGYAAVIRKQDAFLAAIDAEIKRLQALKKTRTNAAKSLKQYLLDAMQMHGIRKIEGATCTASLRKSTALEVYDEEEVIGPYWPAIDALTKKLPEWITVKADISKPALRQAIEDGKPYDGAAVVERMSVTIK